MIDQRKQFAAMRKEPVAERLKFLKYEAEQLVAEWVAKRFPVPPSMIRAGIAQRFKLLDVLVPADVFRFATGDRLSDAEASEVERELFL